MKGSKKAVKHMGKSAIAAAIAEEHSLKKGVCSKIMNSLAALAATEVKKIGKREMFGKEVMVKAKPAKTIVKAYPVAAIKKSRARVSSFQISPGSFASQSLRVWAL